MQDGGGGDGGGGGGSSRIANEKRNHANDRSCELGKDGGAIEIYFNNRPLESNLDHLRKEDGDTSDLEWDPNESEAGFQAKGYSGGGIAQTNHSSSRRAQRIALPHLSPMKGETESPMRTEFQFTTKPSMKNQFLDQNYDGAAISPWSQVSPQPSWNRKTSPGDSTAVPGSQNIELNSSGKLCSCYVNKEGRLKPVSVARTPCMCGGGYNNDTNFKAAQFLEQQKLKLMQSPIGGDAAIAAMQGNESKVSLAQIEQDLQSKRPSPRPPVQPGEKVKVFQFKEELEKVYEVENWKHYNKIDPKSQNKQGCACNIF